MQKAQLKAENVRDTETKFYWWFLTTNHLHLLVYAIAVKRGDDVMYVEDHCMIRRQVEDHDKNNTDC